MEHQWLIKYFILAMCCRPIQELKILYSSNVIEHEGTAMATSEWLKAHLAIKTIILQGHTECIDHITFSNLLYLIAGKS